MEEKKLTGAESLELISRMIETTKKRMEVGSGNKFLLYGYSAVALSVAVFLLVRFTGDPRWNFAWFLMFIPGMVDAAASRKRRPAVVTYMDGVLSGMWWIVGALFFLTVIVLCAMAFVYGVADFSLMLRATHPYPVNNVMTLEGFNTYTRYRHRHQGTVVGLYAACRLRGRCWHVGFLCPAGRRLSSLLGALVRAFVSGDDGSAGTYYQP